MYYPIDYCLAPKLVFGQTIKLPGQFQSTSELATSQHRNPKECKKYFDLNKPQQTSNLSKNKFFRQQFNRLYAHNETGSIQFVSKNAQLVFGPVAQTVHPVTQSPRPCMGED